MTQFSESDFHWIGLNLECSSLCVLILLATVNIQDIVSPRKKEIAVIKPLDMFTFSQDMVSVVCVNLE